MKLQLSCCCSVGDCSVPSSDVTSCGTGSSFLHVIFVPVLTFILLGTNFIPLILTVASSPPALTPLLIFSCAGACCGAVQPINNVITIIVRIIFLFIELMF